jgi:acyl-coenzyme A thioesterase PaaI-like protein
MARRRLHNEDWGFETNCFVCEPKNDHGLQLPFFHDDEADTVEAEFRLDDGFSGAPSFVHGGLTLAILDEAQAWATTAVGGKFAVTTETTSRFRWPVKIGRTYKVVARVTGQDAEQITTSATVYSPNERACVETTATFAVLSAANAIRAIGTDVRERHGSLLKEGE